MALETERLRLRPFEPADLDFFADLFGREDVVRYLYTEPMDRHAAQAWLEQRLDRDRIDDEQSVLQLVACLRESGEAVGEVVLSRTSVEHAQGEIGFSFHPDHHGHGYAGEGARSLLRIGFEDLGLHRVIGRLDARNTASARVLERLGMRREAEFVENELVKGEWTSETVYAVLAREWR